MARNQNTDKTFDIGRSNRKMQNGFLIWNLPEQRTCPGATPLCRKHCYACKASRIYQNVAASRQRNLDFVLHNADWADQLAVAIQHEIARYRKFNGHFRIHEAGDFFTQDYLNGWIHIARAFPNVQFLAFTKSFHLNFAGIPENLVIVFSVMPDTNLDKLPAGRTYAYAGECDYDRGHTVECPGSCDGCVICWDLPRHGLNVHFHMH